MSFIPPFYNKFGKALDDLLSKKFGNKKDLKVKTAASNGAVVFESGVAFGEKGYSGNLKVTENLTDLGVAEFEFDTQGKTKGNIEFDRLVKGAVVKLSATEKPNGNLTVNYKQDNFSSTTSVDLSATSSVVSQSAVVGVDGVSVGGHVDYNFASQKVDDYNVGTEYSRADFTATVVTQNAGDQFAASYIHRVASNLSVGGRLNYNLANGLRLFTVGSEWKLDGQTTVKGKVNSNGEVQAALEQRLRNPALTFGLSTKFDANAKSTTPQEFGVAFTFGDE